VNKDEYITINFITDVAEEVKIKGEGLAPQFTTKLEAREVLAYQEVVLECTVVGIPQPEITWYQVTTDATVR